MSSKNYIMDFLKLKGYELLSYENHVLTVGIPLKEHTCPICSRSTKHVHDTRLQKVKHLPIPRMSYVLIIRKRRLVCPHCHKKFYENIDILPNKYSRITVSLQMHLLEKSAQISSMKSLALDCQMPPSTYSRHIYKMLKYCQPTSLPETIAIDEYKGNAHGHKYQCILTDPVTCQVLDILPQRKTDMLYEYFNKVPLANRLKVKYVVMDMSWQFRSIMSLCFPNAKIVVDKFHAVRLLNWGIEYIRKEEQKKFIDERRKYFKRSRFVLLKKMEYLKDEEKHILNNLLSVVPRLKQAYILKELFMDLLKSNSKETFNAKYLRWKALVYEYGIKKFIGISETMDKWRYALERAVLTGYSNGYTEGCNNRTKVLKRVAFGMRNFENMRSRILMIANARKRAA